MSKNKNTEKKMRKCTSFVPVDCRKASLVCAAILLLLAAVPCAAAQEENAVVQTDRQTEDLHRFSLSLYPVSSLIIAREGGTYISGEAECRLFPHFSLDATVRYLETFGCFGPGARIYSNADMHGLFLAAYWDSAVLLGAKGGGVTNPGMLSVCTAWLGGKWFVNNDLFCEAAAGVAWIHVGKGFLEIGDRETPEINRFSPLVSIGIGMAF
jgi:hypothetical protein